MPVPRVSILIPARNDAAALGRTLDHLAGVAGIEAAEIIVAAAGDAATFRQLGGFRPLRLLEDLDFSRRLKRMGRSVVLPASVETSGRRFPTRGPWRTLAFIVWLLLLSTLRLDTERYAERYRGPADREPGSPGGADPCASPKPHRPHLAVRPARG